MSLFASIAAIVVPIVDFLPIEKVPAVNFNIWLAAQKKFAPDEAGC